MSISCCGILFLRRSINHLEKWPVFYSTSRGFSSFSTLQISRRALIKGERELFRILWVSPSQTLIYFFIISFALGPTGSNTPLSSLRFNTHPWNRPDFQWFQQTRRSLQGSRREQVQKKTTVRQNSLAEIQGQRSTVTWMPPIYKWMSLRLRLPDWRRRLRLQ